MSGLPALGCALAGKGAEPPAWNPALLRLVWATRASTRVSMGATKQETNRGIFIRSPVVNNWRTAGTILKRQCYSLDNLARGGGTTRSNQNDHPDMATLSRIMRCETEISFRAAQRFSCAAAASSSIHISR